MYDLVVWLPLVSHGMYGNSHCATEPRAIPEARLQIAVVQYFHQVAEISDANSLPIEIRTLKKLDAPR